jgi:hypothetical protein
LRAAQNPAYRLIRFFCTALIGYPSPDELVIIGGSFSVFFRQIVMLSFLWQNQADTFRLF